MSGHGRREQPRHASVTAQGSSLLAKLRGQGMDPVAAGPRVCGGTNVSLGDLSVPLEYMVQGIKGRMTLYVSHFDVPVTEDSLFISIKSRPQRLRRGDMTLSEASPLFISVAPAGTHGCRCSENYVQESRRRQAHLEKVTVSPEPWVPSPRS